MDHPIVTSESVQGKGMDMTTNEQVDGGPTRTILVVDDDPRNVELLEVYLTSVGNYRVFTAQNGVEALEQVKAHHPDLILLDIMMPVMDGYEVCAHLKGDECTQLIPIVMVTALQGTDERIKALEAGADDFLSKPFNIYELLARVKSLMRIKLLHDELEKKNQILFNVLNRYVAQEVSSLILKDPEQHLRLGGESRKVAVLFADIRGFTHFSEAHSPSHVVDILNTVFSEFIQVIFKWKGTFDKYLGDAIMAFYGAPVGYDDDTERAVRTAWELREVFDKLVRSWKNDALTALGLGIGLHCGEAVVGNVGSEQVMDYTVIGDTANVARRLQEVAGKGQILISQAVLEDLGPELEVEPLPPQRVHGRREPVACYQVTGLP
jgi:class 3 adenylate cyclase/ActR/RegA family two-component response regulator